MKELESQARVVQGAINDAPSAPAPPVPRVEPPSDPAPAILSALGAARRATHAYHTNLRMVGLQEMTRSGLINEVGDARAQGPSDALVLAVRAIRESSAPKDRPVTLPTPSADFNSGPSSFKKALARQAHRFRKPGGPS